MEKTNSKISVSTAIIIAGLLISLSIFFTTYIFFGGEQNRSRLFFKFPTPPVRNIPAYVPPSTSQKPATSTVTNRPVAPAKATTTKTR